MGSLPTLVIVSKLNQIVGPPAVLLPGKLAMWVRVCKNYTAGGGSVLWMDVTAVVRRVLLCWPVGLALCGACLSQLWAQEASGRTAGRWPPTALPQHPL